MTTNKKKKLKKEKIKVVKVIESKIKEVKSDNKVVEELVKSKDDKPSFSGSDSFEFSNNFKGFSPPRLFSNINLERTTSDDVGVVPSKNDKSNKNDNSQNLKNYVEKAADYSSVRVVQDDRSVQRQSRIIERPVHLGPDIGTPAKVEKISNANASLPIRELDNSPRFSGVRNIPFEQFSMGNNEPYTNDTYVPKYNEAVDNGLGESFNRDLVMGRKKKNLL